MDEKLLRETVNEPLDRNLVDFVEEHPTMGRILRHPLVIQVPLFHTGLANMQYRDKVQAVERARKGGNLYTYVFLHERPYRVAALHLRLAMRDMQPTQHDLWHTVRAVWIDSENMYQNVNAWIKILRRDGVERIMTDWDREVYDSFPEVVTVYRGARQGINTRGLSWTTDREQAEWFAARFDHPDAVIVEGTIPKEKVIAYLGGRSESEIIAHPDDVTVVQTMGL